MAENLLAKYDKVQAAPRNNLLGLIADALGKADAYANKPDKSMPGGVANPPLSMLANMLGVGAIARTADSASYGYPITQGSGWATRIPDDTRDAALAVAPMAGAAIKAAPAAARVASTAMQNAAAPRMPGMLAGQRGAIAWHGSPHTFDRFDSSKIGTGEGAQAYGHGLYLAENKNVANSYIMPGLGQHLDAKLVKNTAKDLGTNDPNLVFEDIQRYFAESPNVRKTFNRINSAEDVQALLNYGALYKVDLPDEKIARMLDWDKPLGQQPHQVQQVAQSIFAKLDDAAKKLVGPNLMNLKGKKLYELIASDDNFSGVGELGASASEALRSAGIPGIRFLDGGSRGAGAGSSNFVIFPGEENALTILERNGKPLR